jgi:hypothetical protein
MAAQLVMRRVYNAKNELIREGLVPKDIANTREALMAHWIPLAWMRVTT